ncbi:hypothetical protein [Pseudomonas sp. GD03944]|uniref:hypothetical protein n=1 Tax=Pseudomonas sp. GD03944 TaxID=2975409 RepID=UPI002449B989|nr:hypothetical protein [Pseudomonas sp. GD03944]MDH1263706.1 hypothetical protein [Pseudomonas sp. GD03944]
MSGQSVWSCLKRYESGWVSIFTAYAYDEDLIIKTLNQKYSKLTEYHGHESGKPGDGIHTGAAENRTAAMQCLRENKPTEFVASAKKTVNNQLKNQNIKKTENMLAIIKSEAHLGVLLQTLTGYDPQWHKDKSAWSAYALKYREKKGKDPQKP